MDSQIMHTESLPGARGTMPRSEGMGATWVCKLAQAIRHGHLILERRGRRRGRRRRKEVEVGV